MITRILKLAAILVSFCLVAAISAYLTLTLIIKSEDTVIVPELTGKDVVYALEMLTDIGLNARIKGSEFSSDIPKNHIISQEPEPGAEIKKDRDVKLFISKGEKTVLMPNLKGLPIQQARIILEENDLVPGALSTTYSGIYNKDEVIAQIPPPGVTVLRNNVITLLASLGPRPKAYQMPDLEGLSIDDAIRQIEKNNLVLGEIKSSYDKNKPRNIIISQEPLSGYRAIEGSTVNLTLNRNPGEDAGRQLQGVRGVRIFRYRTENGFLKRHIKIRVNLFGASYDMFSELVKPGREVWVLIPKNYDATVFLYENNELIKTEVFDAW